MIVEMKGPVMRILVASLIASVIGSGSAFTQEKIRVAELSPQTEKAIECGLAYLIKTQNDDGSWDKNNQVAITSLALMAFMVKGEFPEEGANGKTLSRALRLSHQAGPAQQGLSWQQHVRTRFGNVSALRGLGRNFTRTRGSRWASQGRRSGAATQSDPGWRLGDDPDRDLGYQDMSITVMQIVALASAKEAGILVPDATMKKAVHYVKSCQGEDALLATVAAAIFLAALKLSPAPPPAPHRCSWLVNAIPRSASLPSRSFINLAMRSSTFTIPGLTTVNTTRCRPCINRAKRTT